MIHTFRQIISNDSYFFDILRGWQTARQYGTGRVNEFRDLAKSMVGATVNDINLDTFFHQWFKGEGFPAYSLRWNQSDNNVRIIVSQSTTAPSSVPFFKVPLELMLTTSGGDTTIRITNNVQDQEIDLSWAHNITNIFVDPNNWLIDSVTSVIRDTTLGVGGNYTSFIGVYPNPTSSSWIISASGSTAYDASLTDVAGKQIWHQHVAKGMRNVTVPATDLTPGLYLLEVTDTYNGSRSVHKLMRQ